MSLRLLFSHLVLGLHGCLIDQSIQPSALDLLLNLSASLLEETLQVILLLNQFLDVLHSMWM